jgi:hypothetical protein
MNDVATDSWLNAIDTSVVRSSDLPSLILPPRLRLLGNWFCEGDLGYIFASRGAGKTWLGLVLACALGTGKKVGWWVAERPVKVLYVDGEMPANLMRDYIVGLGGDAGQIELLNHEILFERTGEVLNIANPEVQRAITERCVRDQVGVVIFDNLSSLATGMSENDAASWELVSNWLLQFRRQKIAVIVIHHTGRSGKPRGTSKREDAASWIIALEDARQNTDDLHGARFISRFTKPSRNTPEEIPPSEWHVVTDNVTGEISVECKLSQSMEAFRQLISEGLTSCADLAKAMHVSPATVSRMAHKAMEAGWLKKTNRRQYELNDPDGG